jgi:hypothetical protein
MVLGERGAAEAAQEIADALEAAGLPYAIGGALALAVAGVPRGTIDVDINVFVSEDRVAQVVSILQSLGIEVNPTAAATRARRDGMFSGNWSGMRIDIFLPSIPFAHEAHTSRIRVTDDSGWSGWFLSAEALAVFKLLFFRGKDVVDLERLVAARDDLDRAYIRRWIVDMMGSDDERTRRWDSIVSDFAED